jgi:hypothetical protein
MLCGRLRSCWEDILRACIPRKWEVGGVWRVNVHLELEEPVGRGIIVSGGTGDVNLGGFDPAAFLRLDEQAQEKLALGLMADGLRTWCVHCAVALPPVRNCSRKVTASGSSSRGFSGLVRRRI